MRAGSAGVTCSVTCWPGEFGFEALNASCGFFDQVRVRTGTAHDPQDLRQRVFGGHAGQLTTHSVGDVESSVGQQQLLAPGGARLQVDRGPQPTVGQVPAQHELAVPGALEFLEDHLVHAGARIDERGGDDGQGPFPQLGVHAPGASEKPLRLVQRRGIEPARKRSARSLFHVVVSPREARDRVENDHHVLSHLHSATRPLQRDLGYLYVPLGRVVEAGRDDLSVSVLLHLGDFFGSLVDEQNVDQRIGVVPENPLGNRLQHEGLSGLRRCHDHRALPLPQRAEHVDDPVRVVSLTPTLQPALEGELLAGVNG